MHRKLPLFAELANPAIVKVYPANALAPPPVMVPEYTPVPAATDANVRGPIAGLVSYRRPINTSGREYPVWLSSKNCGPVYPTYIDFCVVRNAFGDVSPASASVLKMKVVIEPGFSASAHVPGECVGVSREPFNGAKERNPALDDVALFCHAKDPMCCPPPPKKPGS